MNERKQERYGWPHLNTAFLTDNLDQIPDAGLAAVDPKSVVFQVVRDVRAWHRQHPDDWRVIAEENGKKVTRDGRVFYQIQLEEPANLEPMKTETSRASRVAAPTRVHLWWRQALGGGLCRSVFSEGALPADP